MAFTPSERRLAENEVVFRQLNEQVQKGFDEMNRMATAERQPQFIVNHTDGTLLHFYCECSDENCTKRVKIAPNEYNDIHKRRDYFVVVPGHEVPAIERVMRKEPEFNVIKKYIAPPERVGRLHDTDVNNV